MVAFVLTPSEQIHECLYLPSSCVTPGQTPQESHTKVMKWIETTVTALPEFFPGNSVPGARTIGNPLPTVLRARSGHHPLVYHAVGVCCSIHTAIVAEFARGHWGDNCLAARTSLGTLVIAAKSSPILHQIALAHSWEHQDTEY